MKVDRIAVYNKYRDSNGCHCSYCGKILPSIKDMQIDHIIPKARGWKVADVKQFTVKIAMDYNIVKLQPWNRKFWFERVGKL